MKLSVIIPVYNVAQYLRRCVDSVINQSYTDMEIILIDDGSTDCSGKICDEYSVQDERIKVIHKKNGGLSSARNAGLDIAKGDYITFIDSDDWICANTYSEVIPLMKEYNVHLANFNSQLVYNDDDVLEKQNGNILVLSKTMWLKNNFLAGKHSYFSVWSKIYAKELIDDLRFNDHCMRSEDVIFNFKVAKNLENMIMINKKYYYYFQRKGSITKRCLTHKDLDAIEAWRENIEFNTDKDVEKLLYLNLYKAEFAFLLMAGIYGVSKEFIDFSAISKKILKDVRKHYIPLMLFNRMDIKRRIALTLMCLNYKLCNKVAKMYFGD